MVISDSPRLGGDNVHVREASVDVRLAYGLHQTVEHTLSDETMHVHTKEKDKYHNPLLHAYIEHQVKALMVKKTLPTKKKERSPPPGGGTKDKEKLRQVVMAAMVVGEKL